MGKKDKSDRGKMDAMLSKKKQFNTTFMDHAISAVI